MKKTNTLIAITCFLGFIFTLIMISRPSDESIIDLGHNSYATNLKRPPDKQRAIKTENGEVQLFMSLEEAKQAEAEIADPIQPSEVPEEQISPEDWQNQPEATPGSPDLPPNEAPEKPKPKKDSLPSLPAPLNPNLRYI